MRQCLCDRPRNHCVLFWLSLIFLAILATLAMILLPVAYSVSFSLYACLSALGIVLMLLTCIVLLFSQYFYISAIVVNRNEEAACCSSSSSSVITINQESEKDDYLTGLSD